ncbi:uncharacterized protein LOC123015225 [Tribolium madens]|uniref:uncharacterized protein LOC123015225 n=1 Tax=Tribolium madens TaxID=41895 RepID=UPI001CF71E34|nr:uncharacterized protein LOC123015225 [Tribolium madens]
MVNWYAVGLAAAIVYILPQRAIATRLVNFYKYRTLFVPPKTVIVVLDDIGLNYEKARKYLQKGARVIIAGLNQQKLETAKKELIRSTKNNNICVASVNRYNKNSLKKFSDHVINTEVAIDVLINNKGVELSDLDIIFKTQELARERFENHCVNFLGACVPEDL